MGKNGVWKVSESCLEGAWKLFGRCLESIHPPDNEEDFVVELFFLKQNKSRNVCNLVGVSWVSGEVSEGCLNGVWKVSSCCLKGVLNVPVV